MEAFIQKAEAITEFEEEFNNEPTSEHSIISLSIQQGEFKILWEKAKAAYDAAVDPLQRRDTKDIEAVKKKFRTTYQCYVRCLTAMGKLSEQLSKANKTAEVPIAREHNIHLPPCDTAVFKGDYLSWPTFRDMFTAIYILNKRLTPVEKLFHLNQKTQGEAKDIVSNAPLTNDGFTIAWKNLNDRYENKRSLVKAQFDTIFSIKPIENDSGKLIKELQMKLNNCMTALKSHKIDLWDALFVYLCAEKLPECSLALWEQSLGNKTEISKWEDMNKFLSDRCLALENVSGHKSSKIIKAAKPQPTKQAAESPQKKLGAFQASYTQATCGLCRSNEHKLRNCHKFKKLSTAGRIEFIKNNNSCLNCLSPGHTVSKCTSSFNCSTCHSRHHTLLHMQKSQSRVKTRSAKQKEEDEIPSTSKQAQQRRDSTKTNDEQTKNVKSCFANSNTGILLGTARVNIHYNGNDFSARALIDSGSECTFITERLKRRINLPSKKIQAQVSGITNAFSAEIKESCLIQLRSHTDPLFSLSTTALVLPQLTGNLPTCQISAMTMQAFPDLELADKRFFVNEQVDLVLGGDVYPQIILEGLRKNVLGTLLAQQTVFGWILTGQAQTTEQPDQIVAYFSDVSLNNQLCAFWELEDLPRCKQLNEEEKYCEELYQRTTTRDKSGKYTVSLPFKKDFPTNICLGPSLKRACSQFFRNETRLAKNPTLQAEYNRVITEYEELGHMSKITTTVPHDSTDNYFLPHHAVVKEESITTKVRVVFNASSPTANGKSLNDVLLTGPVLQADLTILILRWRLFKYVFNSDIEKMYRQIMVNPHQTKYQRIVFRTNSEQPISLYELKTVTFGVNCAPYLAIRTLIQLAKDVETTHPIASNILRKYMYVDDILAGGHCIDSAINAKNQISEVLQSAGFPLRKWTANCTSILKDIPKKHLLNQDFLEFEDTSSAKALGIRWNAHQDEFYFTAKPMEECSTLTKRTLLSAIAKLFDPLGWLAPIIIVAKILMQNIWLEGTGWDETVTSNTAEKWGNFMGSYNALNEIRIKRWVHFSPSDEVEIHGFCDASEKAYAATAYLRVRKGDTILVSLLLAKTRVAPVKTISLPRLELCGAVLLAEMIETITSNLDLANSKIFLWTDSTIVLAWIRKPPCSWSTFVAHRITKIVEKVGNDKWLHVDSESNPADLASRGIPAHDLVNNSLWWQGPSWLQEDNSNWPTQENNYNTNVEEKRVCAHTVTSETNLNDIISRFSKLPRALRVISYILRFFERTHPKTKGSFRRISCLLSSDEINATKIHLTRICQKQCYSNEYASLNSGKPIDAKSEILPLNPFIDKDGIMRTGGRLNASLDLAYNERHPIILPYNCTLSRLIVQFVHEFSVHGENQLMLRLIRTQYWIPRVKNMIRSIIHNCKICTIYKKRVETQLMGNLPKERTTFSRAFTNTGVDFAGPFDIKSYRGRGCRVSKGYVCLFVCFATKAIHLEATTDLSTQSFLAAFSRFIARRGCPKNIFSDNGTNFVGASRSLRAEFKEFIAESRDNTLSKYAHQMLQWHFIPTASPHMGGLWEAGVKSFKSHFKKVASGHKYTLEEFTTLLCRIESCLNSRPLSPASNEPTDLEPLTPGHFLTGGHLLAPPEIDSNENPASIVNRWQKMKALHQTFCKRWKREYLLELQKRIKWKHPQNNIKIGDLVVIKEDNLPPNEWRMGRVTKLHPGPDNLVRVVDLATAKGQTTRPLAKLVLLPPYQEDNTTSTKNQETNSTPQEH